MNREAGFTLVELLAALVAGSTLLVAIGWSLSGVIRLLPRDPAAARTDALARAAPAIEALIEQASPTGFASSPKEMSMIVPAPMAAGPIGPLRATLSVRPESGGESLHAAFEPVSGAVRLPAAARETRLAGGFREIRFDYAAAAGTSADRPLPRLVTISFDDGTVERSISALPRLDGDGTCRFDPVSMSCRE